MLFFFFFFFSKGALQAPEEGELKIEAVKISSLSLIACKQKFAIFALTAVFCLSKKDLLRSVTG